MKSIIIMAAAAFLFSCTCTTSAFAGGHRGGRGGWGNPWAVAGATILTYGAIETINSIASPRVVYTAEPSRSYSYGGCNGSVEYCRGLAEAERRRYEEYRRMEYERGLRDGMR